LPPFSSSLFLFFSSACKVEEPFIPGFKSAGLSGSLSVTTGGQSIFAPEDLKIGEKFWHRIDESIRYERIINTTRNY